MKDLLIKLNACQEAKEWVENKTWAEAYETCPRGDWMLWLFSKTNPEDLQRLTLAKGHCANTVRYLMKDERSINAVDAAISYGEGKSTIEVLNAAAYSASASASAYSAADYAAAYSASASAAYAAAVYAADAAYAAAYAAASAVAYAAAAVAAAAAAVAAAAAAVAAAAAAADAAAANAKKANQQLTADICRKYLPIEIWNVK